MPLFFRHTMYYKTGTSSKRTWQCLRCLVFAFVSKNILLSMLHRFYQMSTSSKKIPIFQCTFRILTLVALYLLEGKFMQSRIQRNFYSDIEDLSKLNDFEFIITPFLGYPGNRGTGFHPLMRIILWKVFLRLVFLKTQIRTETVYLPPNL